jgi:hypothetical protein
VAIASGPRYWGVIPRFFPRAISVPTPGEVMHAGVVTLGRRNRGYLPRAKAPCENP